MRVRGVTTEADADHPFAVLEQRENGNFHIDLNPLVDAMVLQCADEFEAGTVADVREPGISMPTCP